ncbi:MAG: NB-ARC domain-containing protein [Oscillatoriales cyanobacterium SM2_2_1]|nr:NB-ARC domain-containing protein [Oscillatoriales cyanobacterium SM2_2_1]
MLTDVDPFERLFPDAAVQWDLSRLYADLEQVAGKPLKPFEKASLRGLLCRYRPGQIAFQCSWSSGSLRVELNKGLYRLLEALVERPPNTLRWEKVADWLAERGYQITAGGNAASNLRPASASIDWGEAPEVSVFWGREPELTMLGQWLTADQCRLVAVWGMGGIGKTALAVKLVEQCHQDFAIALWRSVRQAPPLVQIAPDLVTTLGREPSADLLEVMRQQRCLIVLDDYETLLQDGELVGTYRPGCEGYGEFLERVARERHQSCLLVLSREQPKEITHHQGDRLPVRSHKLKGLQRAGAVALLAARGLDATANSIHVLIEQYRGNPAALRIVATTIQEVFNGNISEFLQQTALTLGDVLRTLLYQQFERLTEPEKAVLYWLALQRRPVSLNTLREQMEASGSELIAALESLRWRSLLEKTTEVGEALFQLEPVVMKYVNQKFVEEVCREVETLVSDAEQPFRLLASHLLVEDTAPDGIRATQIRLTLKPIKDRLTRILARNFVTLDTLRDRLSTRQLYDYAETNLTLLGLWY